MIHTFEAAYARIEELSKQVEALTNEKYQLIVERDEARAELLVQDAISAMGAKWLVDLTSLRIKYERQRRTIRALVVAFRDALHLTRRVASDETWNLWLQLVQRQAHERRESERNQTSRD